MFEDIIGESKKEEKKESIGIKSPTKDSKDGGEAYELQKKMWDWIKEQQDEDGDPFFFPIFWTWGGK